MDSAVFAGLPVGLQRHLVRRVIERLHPDEMDISYATLERASNFITGSHDRSRIDLPNDLHLLREGSLTYIVFGDATLSIERWPQMPDGSTHLPLQIPGSVSLSGGWKLSCERWNIASLAIEQAKSNEDPFQVWLDAGTISEALELRVRHVSDRFEPLGMDGHEVKLSDFFINVKLPRRARDRWPLLCIGEKVIWVPGYRPAHPFRLTESTRQALYFLMTRG